MTVAASDNLVALLASRPAGRLAQLAQVTKRTAQRWQSGESVPGADDLVRLMSDQDLCAEVLRLAGHASEAERLRAAALVRQLLALAESAA